MTRSTRPLRGLLGLTVPVVLIAMVALPTFAADPSPSPAASERPEKSPRPAKAEKAPATPVTLSGTVGTRTDAEGRTEYTLTTGTTTVVIDGGPSWFYGDNHPLKAYVGKNVTITGSRRGGDTEVDVKAVDGTAIRAAGRPAWAGGWKRVGARHPGWTQEKMDRWNARRADKAKALGLDCFPPGQCKVKPGKGAPAPDDLPNPDAGG
ncbi:MAG: hypothetical protein H0W22_08540 [Chloroflexi bacterium]|nr:hypothetical protein [Chloroflexota bacterium]